MILVRATEVVYGNLRGSLEGTTRVSESPHRTESAPTLVKSYLYDFDFSTLQTKWLSTPSTTLRYRVGRQPYRDRVRPNPSTLVCLNWTRTSANRASTRVIRA